MMSEKSFAWTSDRVLQLISLYEEHECLWNYHIETYRNRVKREESIRKICNTLNVNKQQLVKKIHNLRNQYNFELKKQQKRSAECDGPGPSIRWEYFDRLMFLKPYISHRMGYGAHQTTIPLPSVASEQSNIETEECETLDSIPAVKHVVNKFEYVPVERITNENCVVEEEINLNLVVEEDHPYIEHHEMNEKHDIENEQQITIVHAGAKVENANTERTIPVQPLPANVDEPASKRPRHLRDEHDTFGEFVAHELRNMKNDFSRKKFKRKIMQAMLETWTDDDEVNINICLN